MAQEVQFAEITDGCPEGQGVFDQLMKSIKAHLKEEYDAQRIRGSEYTQVYLNSLQTAMGQSIQWQLGAQIAENQALLIEKQIENAEKQNLLLEEQRQLLIAQTAQVVQATANAVLEADNIPKQGDVLDAQEEQILKQVEVATSQARNTEYQTDSVLPAQVAILDQKLITESAQTQDSTSQGVVEGVIGKQKVLYTNQADGFIRDSEQKASRIVSDLWGISVSADVDGAVIPDEINKTNMDQMLAKLKAEANLP
ncbi:virion structural protein [Vibrio phage 1.097.O._10N.286.49.B3]|uniref:Coil containing protein n=1 Tax=Vibrio phage 1.097.O._10N.286.49.B3 TaxID=1881383 RepID=A0A2I7R0K0_9CAUD|nr:virion structural protein [Vibrio phage 1.097.O._10N.286.49.B3]AUR87171.1 coil containing protein [Vibrio phage 1.097.O._10N.286.49.B3]